MVSTPDCAVGASAARDPSSRHSGIHASSMGNFRAFATPSAARRRPASGARGNINSVGGIAQYRDQAATRLPSRAAARIISAAFSAIMMTAALVLPETMVGMTEASATRSPAMPCTRS